MMLLFLMAVVLSACGGNKVSPNEGEIVFEFPTEYRNLLPYAEIPDYHLTFEGNVNTIDAATSPNKKAFGRNDDFVISDLLADLFLEYEEMNRLEIRLLLTREAYETRMNTLEIDDDGNPVQKSQILVVEGGQIFEEIAYLALENGLTLSFEYRRFVTLINEVPKMMYCWKYTTPLNAVLHYPLVLHVKADETKEFLIVPLPPKCVYHMGVNDNVSLQSFYEKDEFMDVLYRSFYYPDFNDDPRSGEMFDLEANILKVKEFYLNNFSGEESGDLLNFSYLGRKFSVSFLEDAFVIDYFGLA